MIEKVEQSIEETYAKIAADLDVIEREEEEKLSRVRALEEGIEVTKRNIAKLQRRLDSLSGEVGRRSLEEIDREGEKLRRELESHENALQSLTAELLEVTDGKSELDLKIASASRIITATQLGKSELLAMRDEILDVLDERINNLRRTERESQSEKSHLVRVRNEEGRERREQLKQRDEENQRQRLIEENQRPRTISPETMIAASAAVDRREEDRG